MKVRIRESGDVKIMDIEGNVDTNASDELQEQLTQLLDQGEKKIIINLEKMEFIGSTGLRAFLSTQKYLKKNGGELRVCNANEQAQDVFGVAGFQRFLPIHNTESDALLEF